MSVEVTILVGQSTSIARLGPPRQRIPQNLEDEIFDTLSGDPDILGVEYTGQAQVIDEMLLIDHKVGVTGDKLARLFEQAGANAGVKVTVRTV